MSKILGDLIDVGQKVCKKVAEEVSKGAEYAKSRLEFNGVDISGAKYAAGDVGSLAKLLVKKSMLESEIEKFYSLLGKTVFEDGLSVENEDAVNIMNELFDKNRELKEIEFDIEELKAELGEITSDVKEHISDTIEAIKQDISEKYDDCCNCYGCENFDDCFESAPGCGNPDCCEECETPCEKAFSLGDNEEEDCEVPEDDDDNWPMNEIKPDTDSWLDLLNKDEIKGHSANLGDLENPFKGVKLGDNWGENDDEDADVPSTPMSELQNLKNVTLKKEDSSTTVPVKKKSHHSNHHNHHHSSKKDTK